MSENHIGVRITQDDESQVLYITKDGKDILIDALCAEINKIENNIQSFSEMGDHGEQISDENDRKLIAEALFRQVEAIKDGKNEGNKD